MDTSRFNRKSLSICYFIAIFILLFVYFRFVNSTMVFDADDWIYIANYREAYPSIYEWNPTRILPEVVMPIIGSFAAFILTPLTGNYIDSINTAFVASIAFMITIYLVTIAWALVKSYRLSHHSALACSFLFLVMHFWAFKSSDKGNLYLFSAGDLTCYFYYTLPTILNGILVLVFECDPQLWNNANTVKKGYILLLLYLAIFSNMFSSIVLATYCGLVLLFCVIGKGVSQRNWKVLWNSLIENRIFGGILLGWCSSLLFEVKGARAKSVGIEGKVAGIKQAILNFLEILKKTNPLFLCFFIGTLLLIAGHILYQRHQKVQVKNVHVQKILCFLFAALIVTVYQILLCGVTSLTGYIKRGDVLISIYFYIFTAALFSMGYLIQNYPKYQLIIPLLILVALCNCNSHTHTYQELWYGGCNQETASRISKDIYSQVVQASHQNIHAIEIHVPDFRHEGNENNWPITTTNMGNGLAETLYKHRQISHLMEITIIPDAMLNEYYGIDSK